MGNGIRGKAADESVTASATFYDAAGRDIEDVNYGREDTGLWWSSDP